MRTVTLHTPPAGRRERLPVAVADRFSWWTLVFGWLALLRPTAWIAGLLAGALTLVLHHWLGHSRWWWPVLAALHLSLASFLPEIRRWQLALSGWRCTGRTLASSEAAALDRVVGSLALP